MLITTACFVKSVNSLTNCPPAKFPEYAFIGRSNVGKSSLINMLTGIKELAKTSSKPGKTRLINYFIINDNWYLVDLPGYGFAKVSKEQKKNWNKLVKSYILSRKNLLNTFVLIDSRLAPQKNDLDFIEELGKNQVSFALVFTKTDKQPKQKTEANVNLFKQELLKTWEELPPIFLSSALKKMGKEEILAFIKTSYDEFTNLRQ